MVRWHREWQWASEGWIRALPNRNGIKQGSTKDLSLGPDVCWEASESVPGVDTRRKRHLVKPNKLPSEFGVGAASPVKSIMFNDPHHPDTCSLRPTLRRRMAGWPRASRDGLTLLELLLVLGILVLIASLSAPALLRLVSSQSLDKGAEMVRAEMARARVLSIRTGKVHALVLTPGGSSMEVRDFDSVFASGLGGAGSSRGQDQDNRVSNVDWGDGLLPKGVVFVEGETLSTARSDFVSSGGSTGSSSSSGGSSGGSVRPILFYPDGTCQDARVVLQNNKGETKQVTLRGLTGTTRVSTPSDRNGR